MIYVSFFFDFKANARSGDIVMALLPAKSGSRTPVIAMVLSVWVSVKKPKLATSMAPLSHCVAARICVMEPFKGDVSGRTFRCDGCSRAWVIKPESITAVLAFETCANETDFCEVLLAAESMTLIKDFE